MSNGKSTDDSNIKSAADLILKGGTLLSNSCENCGGVQVRFKENIVCVSCGRKVKEINVKQIEEEQQQQKKKKKNTNNNNNNSNSGLSKEMMEVQSNSVGDDDDGGGSADGRVRTYEKVISKKISLLITSLENDSDILIQNMKLDLVSKYLDVLDKLKIIDKES
jgi:uncharacterized Zn finger protein (UPF0148 family)